MNTSNFVIPTWKITDTDGKRIDTLIHCHLESRYILNSELCQAVEFLDKNGEFYLAVWDNVKPTGNKVTQLLISFQKHIHGNFAIIRAFNRSSK